MFTDFYILEYELKYNYDIKLLYKLTFYSFKIKYIKHKNMLSKCVYLIVLYCVTSFNIN